jgi:hypothetical protein
MMASLVCDCIRHVDGRGEEALFADGMLHLYARFILTAMPPMPSTP